MSKTTPVQTPVQTPLHSPTIRTAMNVSSEDEEFKCDESDKKVTPVSLCFKCKKSPPSQCFCLWYMDHINCE